MNFLLRNGQDDLDCRHRAGRGQINDGLSAQSMEGNMIKEHDRKVLKSDIPAEGLKAGDVGTVVHVYRGGLTPEEIKIVEGKA
jgi:hypothetical protein